MRVLAIVHQRDAGPGVFGEEMEANGVELRTWLPAEDEPVPPDLDEHDAVMTFGGAMHVDQEDRHPWLAVEKAVLRELVAAGGPLLGVCLGSQLVAEAAGALPRRASEPEIGWRDVELTPEATTDPLLGALPQRFEAFQWHSYEVPLPPRAVALAHSPVSLQAYRIGESVWGIQFHAEVGAAAAQEWIRDYRSDEDAVRIGLDPESLSQETAAKIAAWNGLGRALCGRFLAVVATRSTA
jgi:GMP synthase-like glutamine amidotransferase